MSTPRHAIPNSSGKFIFQVLATFLPMALLACGATYYFYYSTQDRAAINNRTRETVGIELGQNVISNILQEIRRDLRLASEHYALKNFLDQPLPMEMRDFEQDMLNLSSSSRLYDQIRWLDETGMERVRVNFNNGNPVLTSAEALQNKRARYYFPAAFKLERGEAYISPLDLNIEHDRIEIPHKPMLRIATPVFDSRGDKRGIVLLNFLGAELLVRFDKATFDIADHAMLLNQDGYWLKSPKPEDAWGFMFGRDQLTLARHHPAAWQRILAADSGQFEDAEGLWTFKTIYPGLEGQQTPEGNDLADRAAFWKVVAHLPPQALYGSQTLLKPMLAALAALLLLQLAGSWKLARVRRLRKEAQDQVRHTNLNLERLVEERTAQLQADINLRKLAEDRLHLQSAALEASANAIVITDTEGFIQWANPAYSRLTGFPQRESLGKRPNDLIKSGLQDQAFWEAFWQVIKSGQVWHGEVINKRKDGTLYNEELTITPVRDERGEIAHFIAIKEDISARKRLEQRQLAQFRLLEKATGDTPLTALLEEIIRFIEAQEPKLRCSILLADETRGVLRHGASPSLPDAYNRLVEGLLIAEGSGSCGTACARRQPVIVSDVRNDPLWVSYLHCVSDMDWLRACWSTPFFDSQGRLIGTFGVYAAELRTPSPAESELIDYAVALASLVVERKQANEALRQSESKLASILDSVEAFIYIKDTTLHYQYANRQVCELFGKPLAEVAGQGDEAFFDAATAANLHENDSWVLEHGERVEAEEVNIGKESGQRRTYLSVKLPLKDEDGVIYALCGVSTDITERKRAEEILRTSEKRLRDLIDGLGPSLFVGLMTPAGELLEANRPALAAAGLKLEDVLGKPCEETYWWAYSEEVQRQLREAIRRAAQGEPSRYDVRVRAGENQFIDIDFSLQPLRDETGQVVLLVPSASVITERKQAELHLLNLNRVYTVLSNINQAIVRLRDMDTLFNEACRIAVEDGGFRMAWIGLPDPDGRELRPSAHFGMTQDYLDNIHISLDKDERGRGPTGSAFHEGRYVCCNDIEHDPSMGPWRARALELGYRASIAMPIKVKGVVRGVYSLYASQVDFFNEEEIKLLDELAGDIAFAMEVAEAEAERQRSVERLRQAAVVFESTGEGVMVTDAEQRIHLVNRAFSEITGYTEAEVLGKEPAVLSSGHHDRGFYAALWADLNAAGHWQGEIWNRRKNGELYPELLSISAVQDESGQVSGYVGVFADISKLKSSESELEFLAHHDPLTRLPNRLLLLSRLEHGIGLAQRENRQLALLMLDLDRFKDVNDSFGHLAGDELLQQAAVRLTEHLRGVDTVTRLGGDEFTVLLEDIDHPEDAARVADEIIGALSEPWQLANGVEVRIGASVGISLFPQHGNTAEGMLQQADAALYQAKAEGRGCYAYFTENMTRAARERIELEVRLRRAIAQNELRVFYQPQVDIATGRIIGAEALVRWQDPLEGLIPPVRFIPVAEATGLISAIGEWVLKETCLQGRRWLEMDLPPLTLAVNVSPHQFLSGDLVEVVLRTLAETGFPATHLELELTESALMDRQQEAVDILNRLRAIGVRFAIDDFGTGYSSLAYLKRFPLDVLKIDKSFVDDIPDSQDDREIAAAIVAMGHTLRFKVLAEGVETVEQLAFLQDQGCDSYQGYLKSPPLPPDAFAKLLAES